MSSINHVHGSNLVSWAKNHSEALVFSADLTASTEVLAFKEAYPDRFYSFGLTEQNMMSWAGGMAREGFTPFVHTFAVFMYRRALDQIAISIAYPNLKVRMFGFLPGITTPGGVTHQAIDDISVLRGLPNLTILETGDATDVEAVLNAAQSVDGPVYIRMLRGEMPRLFPKGEPMVVNQARVLSEGEDLTLISSGLCTEQAIAAAKVMRAQGTTVEHLHITTLKPFNDPRVVDALRKTKCGVVTVENHTVIGGLGTAVAELMASHGMSKRLLRIGVEDTFLHGASRPYLMHEYGLDAETILSRCAELVGKRFDGKRELTADAAEKERRGSDTEAL